MWHTARTKLVNNCRHQGVKRNRDVDFTETNYFNFFPGLIPNFLPLLSQTHFSSNPGPFATQ